MSQTILLITYRRLDVTEIEAENIIDDDYHAVDAVTALAGGKKMREGIIYHFNGMGTSTMIARPQMEEYLNERNHPTEDVMTMMPEPTMYSHPDVLSICVCDQKVDLAAVDYGPGYFNDPDQPPDRSEWNLATINATGEATRKFSGKGIKIAILDTGIARHRDLNVKGGVSFCEENNDFGSDRHGHGTHCAGIAAGRLGGIATEAELYSIKVADTASASPIAILLGMGWAHRNRMNVVSISLSGPADLTLMSSCANMVQALMEVNCVVIASTGDSHGDVGFPANTPGIIAVGGCGRNDMILDGTRIGGRGNHMTVVAPGEDIKTTYHAGDSYVQSFCGSSAAVPHVAGLVALIQQKIPGIKPLQVIGRILATAQPIAIRPKHRCQCGDVALIDCNQALSSEL